MNSYYFPALSPFPSGLCVRVCVCLRMFAYVCGAGTVRWGYRLVGLCTRGAGEGLLEEGEGHLEGAGACGRCVELQFENGESFEFDLVVGADGICEYSTLSHARALE